MRWRAKPFCIFLVELCPVLVSKSFAPLAVSIFYFIFYFCYYYYSVAREENIPATL